MFTASVNAQARSLRQVYCAAGPGARWAVDEIRYGLKRTRRTKILVFLRSFFLSLSFSGAAPFCCACRSPVQLRPREFHRGCPRSFVGGQRRGHGASRAGRLEQQPQDLPGDFDAVLNVLVGSLAPRPFGQVLIPSSLHDKSAASIRVQFYGGSDFIFPRCDCFGCALQSHAELSAVPIRSFGQVVFYDTSGSAEVSAVQLDQHSSYKAEDTRFAGLVGEVRYVPLYWFALREAGRGMHSARRDGLSPGRVS